VTRGREALVGAVILAALLVGVGGTLWLDDYGWGRSGTRIHANFREVGQLMEGNPVKLRGVRVGRVDRIRVEPDGGSVVVTMRIDEEIELPESSVVILSPESMFGDWQAEIAARSRYPRYDYLDPPADTLLPGFSLPDMSRLTATADEIAQNLRTLTDRIELAFTEETAQNIAAAIDNIQDVSDQLSALVRQQARNFDDITTEIGSSARELGAAARSARLAFEEVDSLMSRPELDAIVSDMRVAMENLRVASEGLDGTVGNIDGTLARADSAFARIDRIVAGIENGEGTVGRLLTDTTLVSRAVGALDELELLLADFRENPHRYVRLSIF